MATKFVVFFSSFSLSVPYYFSAGRGCPRDFSIKVLAISDNSKILNFSLFFEVVFDFLEDDLNFFIFFSFSFSLSLLFLYLITFLPEGVVLGIFR